jgi:predicted lipoprotein with Yx(FWY)xxD motif
MSSSSSSRRRPPVTILLALALLAVGATAGLALAKSFTLRVSKNVHVTNDPTKAFRVKAVNTHEAVAVGPAGYAVYTFQGENARTHHIICKKTKNPNTNCWGFWPPLSVKSTNGLSKQTGIKGKLGTFMNQGTRQLTLNNQPLYYFLPDLQAHNKKQATGDELKTFGSIWHIVKAKASGGGAAPSPMPSGTSTSSTSSTSTTTTTPYTWG